MALNESHGPDGDVADHHVGDTKQQQQQQQATRSSSLQMDIGLELPSARFDLVAEPSPGDSSTVSIDTMGRVRLSASSLEVLQKNSQCSPLSVGTPSQASLTSIGDSQQSALVGGQSLSPTLITRPNRGFLEHSAGSDSAASSVSNSSTSSSSCSAAAAPAAIVATAAAAAAAAEVASATSHTIGGPALLALDASEQLPAALAADAAATAGSCQMDATNFIEQATQAAIELAHDDDELQLLHDQQQEEPFIVTPSMLADLPQGATDFIDAQPPPPPPTCELGAMSLGAPGDDLRAIAAAAAREARQQQRQQLEEGELAQMQLESDATEAAAAAAVEICRLERSNSCSQAGAAASCQPADLPGRAGPISAAPATASLSHDNLASLIIENNNNNNNNNNGGNNSETRQDYHISQAAAASANASLLSDVSAATTSDLLERRDAGGGSKPELLVIEDRVGQPTTTGQKQASASTSSSTSTSSSSSRFFSSKLNTGSLWSLLSVGSATSSSALNEMPAQEQNRPGGDQSTSSEENKPTESSTSSSSVMTNFFTRQLQFAKRAQQPSSGSNSSFDQQSTMQTTTTATATSKPVGDKQAQEAREARRPRGYRFSIKYVGSAMLHKNFTMPMLEWVVKDIRRQTNRSLNQRQFTIPIRDIVFEIQANQLMALSCKDGHCIFVHPMHCVSKYAQLQHDATCFAYIIRDNKDSPSFCHSFQAKSAQRVHEIFNAIREMTTRNQFLAAPLSIRQQVAGQQQQQQQSLLEQQSSAAMPANRLQKSASTDGHWKSLLAPNSSAADQQLLAAAAAAADQKQLSKTPPISSSSGQQQQRQQPSLQRVPPINQQQQQAMSCAQFENSYQFEVMFVKRVKLQCRRVPPSFVDDALETLKTFEPAPKTQIKGVNKRIISASVDERQEYDETCQSPTPPAGSSGSQNLHSTRANNARSGPVDSICDSERRASSTSLRPSGSDQDGRESKSCQQSPTKLTASASNQAGHSSSSSSSGRQAGDETARKHHQSFECLRNIDCTIKSAKSSQTPSYFNDFSPYNTITSSDLNERIAAIPVVSSSVSLDHETRQKLARQVRETIMATAATIKKDVCASGDQLDPASGSSKLLDSLSCNAQSTVPPVQELELMMADGGDQDQPTTSRLNDQKNAAAAAATTTIDSDKSTNQSDKSQTNEQRRSSAGANLAQLQQSQQSAAVVGNNFDLFRRASARQVVKNRTMLLLIGKDELCAISIDKHQMLFSKSFNSIVHCLQGMSNKDHFGLICRDSGKINPQAESYAGYVFKCQSEKVVREIMGALKQVIYSSQHNYHGYNSPYNPLNYAGPLQSQQQQHQQFGVAPKVSSTHLRQAKSVDLKPTAEQSAVAGSKPVTGQPKTSAAGLAVKRGFAANPIEIEGARLQGDRDRVHEAPPTAPALSRFTSQLTPVAPMTPSSTNVAPVTKNLIKSMFCDECPLYWFHRLCCDIESLPADASKAIILRRIEASLNDREQDEVYSKFSEFNIDTIEEHNEIFMSILRHLNERKQLKHNQSQAHASAMAKNLKLARQQSSELLKTTASLAPVATSQATSTLVGVQLASSHSSGHQRSGSSGGSLAGVINQAASAANQSLVADASSAAIDNLKRAKNSISVSIENMLKRRSSLKEGDAQDEQVGPPNLGATFLSRAGSFKGGTRELRAANSDLQRNPADPAHCEDSASQLINLKRSQSTSDYSQTTSSATVSSWRESLSRPFINHEDLANTLVGPFVRRGSRTLESQEVAVVEGKRASNDNLSLAEPNQGRASSRLCSPSRQPHETFSSRWMAPGRALGHASPSSSASSYLSGAFWKKSIFDKIHQTGASQEPANTGSTTTANRPNSPAAPNQASELPRIKKSREELRSLWKKAIYEQITLLKMDKQNQKLQRASNNIECNIQRMKLNYRDVPYGKEASQLWDKLLKQDPTKKVQFVEVAKLIRLGVPKRRRGEVWMFLMNQYQLRHGTSFQPPPDSEFKGDADQTYRSLLSQLSTQQHEIFVDIGRTFPAHPYYSQYLSIGQLSLFNLLKAYSLLDKEVGYCQGLSFVAGILMLHVDSEDEAFELMRHLLFNFGLRKQYLPSMNALHLQLYQLTRLLRDHHYEIFEQFDRYDISPSLYAAPWFLTLFASQFPLGFVARLLDLIYLIGIEAIFRVSLTLLAYHRNAILECTSLEATMDFMHSDLVKIDDRNLTKIFDDAIALDLRNKLIEYEIEYSFYCAEDKARAAAAGNSHHHHFHNQHHHHALNSSRQSANSSSSTVYSDIRRSADQQEEQSREDELAAPTTAIDKEQVGLEQGTEEASSANGLTSEVADATATVIIQHLLANNHLRSLRSNYSY